MERLSENIAGAPRGLDAFVYITVGTGVGGDAGGRALGRRRTPYRRLTTLTSPVRPRPMRGRLPPRTPAVGTRGRTTTVFARPTPPPTPSHRTGTPSTFRWRSASRPPTSSYPALRAVVFPGLGTCLAPVPSSADQFAPAKAPSSSQSGSLQLGPRSDDRPLPDGKRPPQMPVVGTRRPWLPDTLRGFHRGQDPPLAAPTGSALLWVYRLPVPATMPVSLFVSLSAASLPAWLNLSQIVTPFPKRNPKSTALTQRRPCGILASVRPARARRRRAPVPCVRTLNSPSCRIPSRRPTPGGGFVPDKKVRRKQTFPRSSPCAALTAAVCTVGWGCDAVVFPRVAPRDITGLGNQQRRGQWTTAPS